MSNMEKLSTTSAVEKPKKGFFDSLSETFASLKEKFTTLIESVKKLFGMELSVLKDDIKNNNKEDSGNANSADVEYYISNAELLQENQFADLIVYLSHQQGKSGINQILRASEQNQRLGAGIQRNMANNVHIPTYNKMFHTSVKTKEQMQSVITPRGFLLYWQKIYKQKVAEYKNRTDYDHIITPLAKKYNVAVEDVRVAIGIESTFVVDAGKNGTYVGLMQISPEVANGYGFSKKDRLDPKKNIEMGIRYMVDNRKGINASQIQNTYASLMRPTRKDAKLVV